MAEGRRRDGPAFWEYHRNAGIDGGAEVHATHLPPEPNNRKDAAALQELELSLDSGEGKGDACAVSLKRGYGGADGAYRRQASSTVIGTQMLYKRTNID